MVMMIERQLQILRMLKRPAVTPAQPQARQDAPLSRARPQGAKTSRRTDVVRGGGRETENEDGDFFSIREGLLWLAAS
jgi:hypothetical protein